MIRWAAVFTACGAMACSLIQNTDEHGSHPTSNDPQGSDGQSSGGTGATEEEPDVVAPGTTSGGGGTIDGQAPGGSPCGQTHLFCEDFDTTPLGQNWTPNESDDTGGTLSLDTALFRSGPHALKVELVPTTQTQFPGASLGRVVPMTKQEVELSADLRIDPKGGAATRLEYLYMYLEPPPPNIGEHAVGIVETSVGFQLEYAQDDPVQIEPITLTPREWHHVTLKVSFVTGTVIAIVDGKEAAPAIPIDPGRRALESITAEVGVPLATGSTARHVVHVDNVTVD